MKTILPIEIFPIEEDGYHLKVAVAINEKPANLILDTGASRTVFDETRMSNFIEKETIEAQDRLSTGIGTSTMESKKVVLGKLEIGEVTIKNYNAAVLDLTHVNHSYEKLGIELVDGVLGSDILYDYNAVIDYEKRELILTRSEKNNIF